MNTTTPNTRSAVAQYVLTRTLWSGNWRHSLLNDRALGLPSIRQIVQRGSVNEALDAMTQVHRRAEYFKARAARSRQLRLSDVRMYEGCVARCRIAYRALLIVADADQAAFHVSELMAMIQKNLKARYQGPALPNN